MKFRFLCAIYILAACPLLANACACTSTAPGQCAGLQQSDVVFLGTVLDVEAVNPVPLSQQLAAPGEASSANDPSSPTSSSPNATPIFRYHFRIDEKFAGSNAAEIDIFSGGDDGDCGYKFEKGKQYVVFTQPGSQGALFATICNGTRQTSEGAALIPQLRAMRDGKRVASVFGVMRFSDPPFLSPPSDPDDPVPQTSLKLRSVLDRFQSNTDQSGVFSFYDVNGGEYQFTADLPEGTELTQKNIVGALPPFTIPDDACYEYNVTALPTGHIHGSVLGPDGKPLEIAALELYRAGTYSNTKAGYWTFQGIKGSFDFAHIGPGEYILVYNRTNRMDPNSPFPRTFYPGVANAADAQKIVVKQDDPVEEVNLPVSNGYPVRTVRVHVKWTGSRPDGGVIIAAKADHGENPAADHIDDNVYAFTLFQTTSYTISAWENLDPDQKITSTHKVGKRTVKESCAMEARIDADPITVSGADTDPASEDVTVTFPKPACAPESPAQR